MLIFSINESFSSKFEKFLPGHSFSLHSWVWVKSSVKWSQPAWQDRDLIDSPTPHVAEQADQSLQDVNRRPIQNTCIIYSVPYWVCYIENLQSASLQISVWIRSLDVASEHIPPIHVLLLVFSPLPHVLLHSEYESHVEYTWKYF